jgi:hypothetical protein
MELHYQLTAGDYLKAIKTARSFGVKWFFRIFSVFAFLMLCIEVYLMMFLHSDPRAQNMALNLRPLVIFLVIWVAFVSLLPRLSARSQFRGTPVANLPVTLTVSEEGLRFRTSANDTSINWSAFVKFLESKDSFVYFASAKAFNVIPKRAFTPSQLQAFRDREAQSKRIV